MKVHRIKFDVISVDGPLEALFLLFFQWAIKAPYVFVLEGYTGLEAKLARYATASTAISNSLSGICTMKFGYTPEVIPIGINRDLFCPSERKLPGRNEKFVISTLSHLSTRKRIDILIDAATILKSDYQLDNFLVNIGGDGKDRGFYENLVREKRLVDTVHFTGRLQENELPNFYRYADVFVNCESAPDDY